MTQRCGRAAGAFVLCWLALTARADDAPPAASPAAEIGRSIFVVNDVDGQAGDAPARRIAVNDDILYGEDVTTGDEAKAVLEFRDGSTFEIGPDAAVRIDSFVFNPEESTSHKTINVTHGVFRYVSGYIASDQEARIATPHGQMGIRGSVAAGIVDPDLPDFVFLGEGSATFSNAAGNVELQPGSAIAVPSASAPPMRPANMPPAVAAQALQAIDKRLPPRSVLANRPPADEAWLKRAGAADLVPAAEQRRLVAAAANRPPPAARARSGIAAELGLLAEGNRLDLFRGGQTARTAEQAAFLDRTAHVNPTAAGTVRRFTADARAMHGAAVSAGTAFVIRGVGHAAGTPEVMRRVTAASVHANPAAAALINRQASEALRRPAGAAANRPAELPGARQPAGNAPRQGEPSRRLPGQRGPNQNMPVGREPAGRVPARRPPPVEAPNRTAPAARPGYPAPTANVPYVRPPNEYERRGRPPPNGPATGPAPLGNRAPATGPAPLGNRAPAAGGLPGARAPGFTVPGTPPATPRNGPPPAPRSQEQKPPPKKKGEERDRNPNEAPR